MKQDYQILREHNGNPHYLGIGDQLDLLWHAIDADEDLKVKFADFYNAAKVVKDKYPKPS